MVGIATKLIHGADEEVRTSDITPPINVSTTFRYPQDASLWVEAENHQVEDFYHQNNFYYSRLTHPNSELAETALSKVLDGHVVVYNSGLSAFFALLTHVNPKRLVIGQAYHGCHSIANIFTRNHNLEQLDILNDASFEKLQPGDLVHLESPVNPEGLNFDIEYFAKKAHEKGAVFSVDSTFAPPPLQDPFKHGADFVMHSATKYFGGHSDLLAGLLVTKDKTVRNKLFNDRIYLGTNIGNLEASLLVRSLKTFELRILKQSDNATQLVKYLSDNLDKFPKLLKVLHGSLQTDSFIKSQTHKHSPTFAIVMKDTESAKALPGKLKYFYHATSLGGVESLIEWRALSDSTVDKRLLRVSVGVENIDDLIDDFTAALS